MKTLTKILGLSLLTAGILYASGNHGNTNAMKTENNHMGNHMHEGKMSNHMNMDGMTDEEMKKMKKMKAENNHMGNHMHEGKMTNHMNMGGMTDEEMKKMK